MGLAPLRAPGTGLIAGAHLFFLSNDLKTFIVQLFMCLAAVGFSPAAASGGTASVWAVCPLHMGGGAGSSQTPSPHPARDPGPHSPSGRAILTWRTHPPHVRLEVVVPLPGKSGSSESQGEPTDQPARTRWSQAGAVAPWAAGEGPAWVIAELGEPQRPSSPACLLRAAVAFPSHIWGRSSAPGPHPQPQPLATLPGPGHPRAQTNIPAPASCRCQSHQQWSSR